MLLASNSSLSSMFMILRFGLWMESLSFCIFLSQILSCLAKNSAVFPSFLFYLWALRFCLPLILVCCSSLPLCFLFD
jgi:hypothetical protein